MRSFIICTPPNIIRMVISTRFRKTGHVTCMGEIRNAYKILVGKPEGKRPLEDLGTDGRILRWILGK
jgi:hypothetical protein